MADTATATPAATVDTKAATVAPTPAHAAPATAEPKVDAKGATPAAPPKVRISMAEEAPKTDAPKADATPEPAKDGDVKVAEGEVVYDLKMPEGAMVDDSVKESVVAFAKEHKLAPEVAQKMLERENSAKVEFFNSNKPGGIEWSKRADQMEADALADAEIGGSPEKLKASAELGRRVLDKYFSPSVKQFLIESGLGSNKELIRGFVKIAKASKDDTVVMPGAQGGPASPGDLEAMY